MNPLTLVKRTQKINSTEAALGISDEASWHAKYKDSAYIFVGGIPFDLTEGDLLAVFAQYGEVVDVNLVRDKGTGKSKGFAFLAYEDQRSTILAVDNLNGAKVLGRIVRVDHVTNYKKKEEVDEEEEQKQREVRGVCRAFQRGDCNRGAACKFSHNEQRSANTGWGDPNDRNSRWENDKYEDLPKSRKHFSGNALAQTLHYRAREGESKSNSTNKDGRSLKSNASASEDYGNNRRLSDWSSRNQDKRGNEKSLDRSRDEGRPRNYGREEDGETHKFGLKQEDDWNQDKRGDEKLSDRSRDGGRSKDYGREADRADREKRKFGLNQEYDWNHDRRGNEKYSDRSRDEGRSKDYGREEDREKHKLVLKQEDDRNQGTRGKAKSLDRSRDEGRSKDYGWEEDREKPKLGLKQEDDRNQATRSNERSSDRSRDEGRKKDYGREEDREKRKSGLNQEDDRVRQGEGKWRKHDGDSSFHYNRKEDDEHYKKARR